MGAFTSMKLCLLLAPAAVLLALFALPVLGSSSPCPAHQYWRESREACVNCSVCSEPGHIVLRPCQVNQNAKCGPLHELNIDWSWVGRNYASSNSSKHHNHHHHKKHGHSSHWSSSSSSSSSSSGERRYHKHWHHEKSFNASKKHHLHHHHHHKKMRPPESAAQLKELDASGPVGGSRSQHVLSAPLPADPQRRQQQAPFSTAETLVWDWQAVVLVMAVLACVLFFVAAAGYGVLQARKDSFRTDVEDLTATLSLMVLESNSDNLDSSANVVEDCNTNHCLYMEQLLVRKQQDEPRQGKGNVYIDRDNATCPRV